MPVPPLASVLAEAASPERTAERGERGLPLPAQPRRLISGPSRQPYALRPEALQFRATAGEWVDGQAAFVLAIITERRVKIDTLRGPYTDCECAFEKWCCLVYQRY